MNLKALEKTAVDNADQEPKVEEQLATVDVKTQWVVCPWCEMEWMFLYHGICIGCNRDVRGFLKAQKRMPIPHMKVTIEVKKWARDVPKDCLTPECFLAVLNCGLRKFYAEIDAKLDVPIKLISDIETENQTEAKEPGKLPTRHKSVFDAWRKLMCFISPNSGK